MKDKEKQIEEILKLDILDCVGIKLAYLDNMRISKSKPLSVMKNMLSIDCRKDYILEALGITKDSIVLSREEWECLHTDYAKALYNVRQNAIKETAVKILNEMFECINSFGVDYVDIREKLKEIATREGVEIKE